MWLLSDAEVMGHLPSVTIPLGEKTTEVSLTYHGQRVCGLLWDIWMMEVVGADREGI